jgi:streptomycin 3"-adenylyltransferase
VESRFRRTDVGDRLTRRASNGLEPRARAQVDGVVALLDAVFGQHLVGAYLHGSALTGGLRPSSDLDLLAVTGRPTTPGDRRALIDHLLGISGSRARSGPARSIELSIVVQADVRPWVFPPNLDFQFGDWWRPEFARGDISPWRTPNPDLAVMLASARERSEPLVGPELGDMLDPIPRADINQAMLDGIPDLLADLGSDTRNVILTLARIWYTTATGSIEPKDVAADWVLARLPEEDRAVLAHARAIYLGDEPERWDDLRMSVRRYVEFVIEQIRAV